MRQIHIPTAISPTPSPQEMLVAQIISEYFDRIISLIQCKMHSNQAISRIKYELSKANTVKHLIVIKKDKKIIVLK